MTTSVPCRILYPKRSTRGEDYRDLTENERCERMRKEREREGADTVKERESQRGIRHPPSTQSPTESANREHTLARPRARARER